MTDDKCIIILAAGESSRMGIPKQLLSFKGRSLIQMAIENGIATKLPVLVVLGAFHQKILPEINDYPVDFVVNPKWDQGISSSIRCGLARAIAVFPHLSGVLITLADQPYVTREHLDSMVSFHTDHKSEIIATEYQGVRGVPAFFFKTYFDTLMQLTGDQGARSIIHRFDNKVYAVPFSKAWFDIDTEEDWQNFLNESLST